MFVGAREIEKKIGGNLCQLSVQNGAKPGGAFFKEMSNLTRGTIKIIIWNKACIYRCTFDKPITQVVTTCTFLPNSPKFKPTWACLNKLSVCSGMLVNQKDSFIVTFCLRNILVGLYH